MKTFLKVLAVILLLYLGIGALYGSWMFISDPGGGKIKMSLDYLKNTPFNDYLIPGIILLIVNGLFPIFIIVSMFIGLKNYNWFLVFQGILLAGWLSIELIMNPDFFVPVLHYPLYATGLLLMLIGFLVRKNKKVQL
ncbi:MAG: hypothetical protein U0W24_08625 [Bacteroidales bacterium]